MIDLHSHILHGIDDGPETLAESVELARGAVADGTEAIAATPHVRDDWPTTPELMETRLGELRSALADARVPLEVLPGGEVAIERLPELGPDDLRRYGLGGNPSYLLVEFPYTGWPLALSSGIFELRADGITAVIAHPERNREVQAEPARLRQFVEAGALVQLTAASLDGRVGRGARAAAAKLLEFRLAHLVASDAHTPGIRKVGLSAAFQAVGDKRLAHWLFDDVPRAIVEDRPLPIRPRRLRRRWFDRIRA